MPFGGYPAATMMSFASMNLSFRKSYWSRIFGGTSLVPSFENSTDGTYLSCNVCVLLFCCSQKGTGDLVCRLSHLIAHPFLSITGAFVNTSTARFPPRRLPTTTDPFKRAALNWSNALKKKKAKWKSTNPLPMAVVVA